MRNRALVLASVGVLLAGAALNAEDAPPAYPQVKVGGLIFADYTHQAEPVGTDADGNRIRQNAFNIGRAYINVIANLSRLISARITPDIVRESDSASSLSGSYAYRLKFAYGQFSLEDLLGKGSWVKFGMHQTPYLDYTDAIYRYRFQGNLFLDREGYLSTSDTGVSARYAFPGEYGEAIVGGFNGEGFNHSETNDQKALQIFASVRPAPRVRVLRGLRVAAFYDYDHYQRNDDRERSVATITFEHPWLHVGGEYFAARDRPTAASIEQKARGWSAFATPRTPFGLEGLFRYDSFKPDKDADAKKTRTIAGVAYWFPVQKGLATALLLDYEKVRYAHFAPAKPTEERYALHTLINF